MEDGNIDQALAAGVNVDLIALREKVRNFLQIVSRKVTDLLDLIGKFEVDGVGNRGEERDGSKERRGKECGHHLCWAGSESRARGSCASAGAGRS